MAGADRIHDWARAPMQAYRFVAETPLVLTWENAATGAEITSINVGSASLLQVGECAIGRLVPIDGGAMFETAPLFVPEDLAARVAADPDDWIAAVSEGCRRQGPPEQRIGTHGHDFRLLTDVPFALEVHHARLALEHSGQLLAEARLGTDPPAALARFVRIALEGELDHEDPCGSTWPSVAAALLTPRVFRELLPSLVARDAPKLDRLAGLLAAPGDALCRGLSLEKGWAA